MIFSTLIRAEGAENFLMFNFDLLVDANDEYSKRKRLNTKANFQDFRTNIHVLGQFRTIFKKQAYFRTFYDFRTPETPTF